MANPVFKNFALSGVGTSAQVGYTAPSGKTSVLIQLDIANMKNAPVQVWVYMNKGGTPYYLVNGAEISVGGTLQAIYGQKQVLTQNDAILVKTSVSGGVDVIGSVTEDV